MAGCHHRLVGREFEWTPGVDDGQGGLACCGSWGRKESDTTEWLNWTELNWMLSCDKLNCPSGIHPGITMCLLFYLPCMALGDIYDHLKFMKILFEKELTTVPFCWSHHLLLLKSPSYLSSFLAPGWVLLRNENESKGNLKSGSSLEREPITLSASDLVYSEDRVKGGESSEMKHGRAEEKSVS